MRDWYYGAFHFEKKMLKKTASAESDLRRPYPQQFAWRAMNCMPWERAGNS
jgi:hypothetical protein